MSIFTLLTVCGKNKENYKYMRNTKLAIMPIFSILCICKNLECSQKYVNFCDISPKDRKHKYVQKYQDYRTYLIIQNTFLLGTSPSNRDILYQSDTQAPTFRIYSFPLIKQVDPW